MNLYVVIRTGLTASYFCDLYRILISIGKCVCVWRGGVEGGSGPYHFDFASYTPALYPR